MLMRIHPRLNPAAGRRSQGARDTIGGELPPVRLARAHGMAVLDITIGGELFPVQLAAGFTIPFTSSPTFYPTRAFNLV